MKRIIILTIILIFILSVNTLAVSPIEVDEFINNYPNDHIYKIEFEDGTNNVLSSPKELEFELSDYNAEGEPLKVGKALLILNPTNSLFYRLKSTGDVISYTTDLRIIEGPTNDIGIEGDIDIYKWNGSSFFLPTPFTFLRGLVGQIQKILPVGFGIVLGIILVHSLKVLYQYF